MKNELTLLLTLLPLVVAALWVDSCFHERHFIFLPGGDVGQGIATGQG